MTTINYDRPVKDLIDELNATGHVTHASFKKTSVTLHHNAGRLSHEGVLNVWKVRPASAHFDVDAAGAVAQYVKTNEYAWSVGNRAGNESSISIEMANSALSPSWAVSETTWKSAARLAGWLFAHVVGARPDSTNFFRHKHWSSTACAGPYIDSVWGQVMAEAQRAYDQFKSSPAPAPKPSTSPSTPAPTRKSNETIAAEVWAGKWGSGDDRKARLTKAGYNYNTIQALVNKGVGRTGSSAPRPTTKSIEQIAAEVWAGKWGTGEDRIQRLTKAGYNARLVQMIVNRGVGRHTASKTPPSRDSIRAVAQQVIAGQWGNDPERTRRLTHSGYDAAAVQAEVNRQLR